VPFGVIASEAKQSLLCSVFEKSRLLHRFTPRNDRFSEFLQGYQLLSPSGFKTLAFPAERDLR
jgi:hypothetical protein